MRGRPAAWAEAGAVPRTARDAAPVADCTLTGPSSCRMLRDVHGSAQPAFACLSGCVRNCHRDARSGPRARRSSKSSIRVPAYPTVPPSACSTSSIAAPMPPSVAWASASRCVVRLRPRTAARSKRCRVKTARCFVSGFRTTVRRPSSMIFRRSIVAAEGARFHLLAIVLPGVAAFAFGCFVVLFQWLGPAFRPGGKTSPGILLVPIYCVVFGHLALFFVTLPMGYFSQWAMRRVGSAAVVDSAVGGPLSSRSAGDGPSNRGGA